MTTLLFLPSATRGYRWISIADDRVTGEGDGVPGGDDAIVAVAPAEAVTLHWAELPARSGAQAAAAARILVTEASAEPIGELHVAVGDEGTADRPIGVVSSAAMREWLEALAHAAVDPVAIVPAPMLLPRPEEGFVGARIVDQGVIRGPSSGFADEAPLTALVTGGEAPTMLGRDALGAALVASATAVPLDLRQGAFARRRRRSIDWALVKRLAILAGAALLVTLAIDVVRIIRLNHDAGVLEARSAALAATALPRGETITDADRQLAERLSALRGPGAGFSASVAAVYAAVRSVPGVELTGMDFSPNGKLRLSVAAARESLPTDLKRALVAAGFEVDAGVFQSSNGRVTGDMTVTPR